VPAPSVHRAATPGKGPLTALVHPAGLPNLCFHSAWIVSESHHRLIPCFPSLSLFEFFDGFDLNEFGEEFREEGLMEVGVSISAAVGEDTH
jgi:hypothetical protein